MPRQELVGEKVRDAERLVALGFADERRLPVVVVMAVLAQQIEPRVERLAQVEHPVEAGQHSLICGEARVVGTLRRARVDSLVGVAEQRWRITEPTPESRHIVE